MVLMLSPKVFLHPLCVRLVALGPKDFSGTYGSVLLFIQHLEFSF